MGEAVGEAAVDGRALYAKISWRLIPYIFLLYIVAYLDRVNVGFAALDLERDLHFRATKTLSAYADEARAHGAIRA